MNIYDAWNRLVEVRIDENGDGNYDEVRARYGYNGLHQRATRRANSNDLVIDGDDPGHLYYYDASWRLLEERIDAAWDGAGNTFASEKIIQRIWDPLYIDALIAMQTDVDDDVDSGDPDGDFTDADADIYYAVLDRKYDVIAMMSAGGTVVERVRYTAYGAAQNHPNTDLNGDGAVNGADLADYLASGGSRADTDFNRDGSVDGADLATLLSSYTAAAPEGVLSRLGNTIGYSGYIYDDAINMSLARFRWYDAEMGRWMTRDPLGTQFIVPAFAEITLPSPTSLGRLDNGSALYQYVESNPILKLDPLGLASLEREWPSEIPRNLTPDELRDLEKNAPTKRIKKAARKARKLLEEQNRLRNKGPQRRGGASRGTIILLAVSAAIFLDDAADLMQSTHACGKYLKEIQKAIESGKCNRAAIENMGRQCSEDVQMRLGTTAWHNFERHREDVRKACDELDQNNTGQPCP